MFHFFSSIMEDILFIYVIFLLFFSHLSIVPRPQFSYNQSISVMKKLICLDYMFISESKGMFSNRH